MGLDMSFFPQQFKHFYSILKLANWCIIFPPHLLLDIFFIYISNAIPKVPHAFPPHFPPPTPTSWPWLSPVVGQIKFARPMGLSFHWWQTRPSSDTYAARDRSCRGYWVVHIVVPPIGLQIPPTPWVLFLAPTLGAPVESNSASKENTTTDST